MEQVNPKQDAEIKLELEDLDLADIEQLSDTALGNILREINENNNPARASHSSHSSYSTHGTAMW